MATNKNKKDTTTFTIDRKVVAQTLRAYKAEIQKEDSAVNKEFTRLYARLDALKPLHDGVRALEDLLRIETVLKKVAA